jgi:hypothetical protein
MQRDQRRTGDAELGMSLRPLLIHSSNYFQSRRGLVVNTFSASIRSWWFDPDAGTDSDATRPKVTHTPTRVILVVQIAGTQLH